MHLHNKRTIGMADGIFLMAAAFGWPQTSTPGQQGNTQTPGTPAQTRPQATPLPEDIDPNDPALPAWMRPASPVKPLPPDVTPPPGGTVPGAVSKDKDGFRIRKEVDEVTLHASVL